MADTKGTLPAEPGLYWAKYKETKKWVIASVYGPFPFMSIDIFDVHGDIEAMDDCEDNIDPEIITQWGPKIPNPE